LKKDRNCMGVYPQMMPSFNGMVMPGEMVPMPGNYMVNVPTQMPNNTSDISTLSNQLNSLEQRVRRLESIVNNGSNYNSSNYQIM